jgi:hypothetical protein
MKDKVLQFLFILLFSLLGSLTSNAQIKPVYLGEWSFNAPSAPEEYNYGTIEIKKDSIITIFSELNYKALSIWVKVKNDSIIYKSFVDDTDVLFSLKIEDETNIKGNAVWNDGETQMILHKKTNPQTNKKNP